MPTTGVPPELHGAWRRTSIQIGAGPAAEPYDVIWIQGDPGFADLRIPRNLADDLAIRCFAGTAQWGDQRLTWTHAIDIDLQRRSHLDTGVIELRGETLIESGETPGPDGVPVRYVEEYERLSHPQERARVDLCHHRDGSLRGVRAQVGQHRLTVIDDRTIEGGLIARYEERVDDAWSPRLLFGPQDDTLFDAPSWICGVGR